MNVNDAKKKNFFKLGGMSAVIEEKILRSHLYLYGNEFLYTLMHRSLHQRRECGVYLHKSVFRTWIECFFGVTFTLTESKNDNEKNDSPVIKNTDINMSHWKEHNVNINSFFSSKVENKLQS